MPQDLSGIIQYRRCTAFLQKKWFRYFMKKRIVGDFVVLGIGLSRYFWSFIPAFNRADDSFLILIEKDRLFCVNFVFLVIWCQRTSNLNISNRILTIFLKLKKVLKEIGGTIPEERVMINLLNPIILCNEISFKSYYLYLEPQISTHDTR